MIPLAPGEYLYDMPGTDGSLTALCRCPGCFQDFSVDQAGKPEVCKGHPVALECMNCGRYETYRSANYRATETPRDCRRRSKVRGRRPDTDTPLFS